MSRKPKEPPTIAKMRSAIDDCKNRLIEQGIMCNVDQSEVEEFIEDAGIAWRKITRIKAVFKVCEFCEKPKGNRK